jgi:hypothetical protein
MIKQRLDPMRFYGRVSDAEWMVVGRIRRLGRSGVQGSVKLKSGNGHVRLILKLWRECDCLGEAEDLAFKNKLDSVSFRDVEG